MTPLSTYDHIIVAFSGGKDSLACMLHVLEAGAPFDKVELWHHDIDGREGSDLMDWPCTRAYCRAVAEAFGLPIYYSWKQGGFEREMLRHNARTAPISFEEPAGGGVRLRTVGGTRGKLATRRRFPQVSADLSVRWCSAYLKIDVAARALTNQDRFLGKRTLFVTGERAEESAARKGYAAFEPHRTDTRSGTRRRRHVDHWRPVHAWTEAEVWDVIRLWQVNPHPAYHLGWGRVSCMNCIFASARQAATSRAIAPARFARLPEYEAAFGTTIKRRGDFNKLADGGTPYEAAANDYMRRVALSGEYAEPVLVENWHLPAGAFGESCGPS